MADEYYTIRDENQHLIQVRLRRDRRLRKTMRWERLPDGAILVRIPLRLPKRCIAPMLEKISQELDKLAQVSSRRTDADLQQRAELINHKYFDGKIQWSAIRWVSNMQSQLGSCSQGGTTDGHIRISDKIKSWPEWVVNYVIAHELMHCKYPNHSACFWNELRTVYPLTERARGFAAGIYFKTGQSLEDKAEE